MKIKDRLKTAGFWAGIVGAVFLILAAFGVEIADETASSVINAVCSALVVLGIVSDVPTGSGSGAVKTALMEIIGVSDKAKDLGEKESAAENADESKTK